MLTEAKMRALTKGLPSKSAKMRALANAGVPRADIARFLGTNYAFVRNVLEAEEARTPGFAEQQQEEYRTPASKAAPTSWRLRVVDGAVAIPVEALAAIGFTGKDDVILMEFENERELRAWSFNEAVRHAQVVTRPFRESGRSILEELRAERRREFEMEQREIAELRARLAK